jgi:hypothetical protein
MKKSTFVSVLLAAAPAIAQDTTPPEIVCPADVTVEADEACTAVYEGPAATATDDVDAAPEVGPTLPAPLGGPGVYVITHTATDEAGNVASCEQDVTVVDATPPAVTSVEATPACLWPPNHKMVAFRAGENLLVEATDNCDTAPALDFSATTSNESEDGRGDGHTAPDFLSGGGGFCLRAERSGGGGGRLYTVEVRAVDAAGNTSADAVPVEVRVPHDQSGHDCPALVDEFVDDETTCTAAAGADGGTGADAPAAAGCSIAPSGQLSGAPGFAALLVLLALAARRQWTGRPGTK